MSKWMCQKCDPYDPCYYDNGKTNTEPVRCPITDNKPCWEPIEREQFGNSEQLPKLTAEVFNRPDCPEWAKYAAVSSDGRCIVCRERPVIIGGRRWANPESYWEGGINDRFDPADWGHSLIERPEKKELRHTPDFLPIRFKKLHPDAKAPYQATPGSAGFDLTAISSEEIDALRIRYGTGLAVEIPAGHVGLVFPRSSIYKTCQRLTNCVGVIDSDYRGEISAVFSRAIPAGEIYNVGDLIAQLVIMPIPAVKFVEAEELTETERGAGGYGSTGR